MYIYIHIYIYIYIYIYQGLHIMVGRMILPTTKSCSERTLMSLNGVLLFLTSYWLFFTLQFR